jgi:hypothetical protein
MSDYGTGYEPTQLTPARNASRSDAGAAYRVEVVLYQLS